MHDIICSKHLIEVNNINQKTQEANLTMKQKQFKCFFYVDPFSSSKFDEKIYLNC